MISEQEVRVGTKVRVQECLRDPKLRGLVGEVVQVHGTDDYRALAVRFTDGRSSLFWDHELEEAGEGRFRWWRSLFFSAERTSPGEDPGRPCR